MAAATAGATKPARLESLRAEVAALENELGTPASVATALARLRRAERVAAVELEVRSAEAKLRDAEAVLTQLQASVFSCCSSAPGRAQSRASDARRLVGEARQRLAAAAAVPACEQGAVALGTVAQERTRVIMAGGADQLELGEAELVRALGQAECRARHIDLAHLLLSLIHI